MVHQSFFHPKILLSIASAVLATHSTLFGSMIAAALALPVGSMKTCVDNHSIDPISDCSSGTGSSSFIFPTTGDSITSFLNPNLFQDPETIHNIQLQLRAGKPVIIQNAFQSEYAEAMYQDLLSAEDAFELHEYSHEDDDFSCHHYNIYDLQKYTLLMNATLELFNSTATKEFASELSGRRCGGETWPAASWYKPGSHSLPHSDWADQRTVAYVWHLTKDWKHVRAVFDYETLFFYFYSFDELTFLVCIPTGMGWPSILDERNNISVRSS